MSTLQSQLRSVKVDGMELAYVEQGSGGAVVFVHGGFSDYRSWESQVRDFSNKYRAISYSLRYHYPNLWGNGTDYNLQVHTKDLASLIEQLEASPAHVVGTSYGGRIALHLARDRPRLVRSLVLAEPAVGAWLQQIPGGPSVLAEVSKDYFDPAEKAMESGDLELATRLFVTGVSGKGWFERLPEEARRRYLDNIRVQGFPSSPSPFTREEAARISVPVLLLRGELTTTMFRMVNDELQRCLPNVESAEIPASSHLMTVFNPDAFNRTVQAFLSKHG